jgi:ABC-type branched-subunit amino acid transport system ATPase component
MDLGRIVYDGSARALLADDALAARYLGKAAA